MDDPSSLVTSDVTIVLAFVGAGIAFRLIFRRRRSHDDGRQIIEQLRTRVVDVRDVERDNDPDGLELGA